MCFLAGTVKVPRTRWPGGLCLPQRTLSSSAAEDHTEKELGGNKTTRVLRTRMEADLRLVHILDCEASLNPYRILHIDSVMLP